MVPSFSQASSQHVHRWLLDCSGKRGVTFAAVAHLAAVAPKVDAEWCLASAIAVQPTDETIEASSHGVLSTCSALDMLAALRPRYLMEFVKHVAAGAGWLAVDDYTTVLERMRLLESPRGNIDLSSTVLQINRGV